MLASMHNDMASGMTNVAPITEVDVDQANTIRGCFYPDTATVT